MLVQVVAMAIKQKIIKEADRVRIEKEAELYINELTANLEKQGMFKDAALIKLDSFSKRVLKNALRVIGPILFVNMNVKGMMAISVLKKLFGIR